MNIPESIIEEISEKTNIVDIVSHYTSLTRKGDKHWGCCPFHSEKTPSFTVTESKNMFYCFGCQKGGSIFNFLMEIEKMSFIESVKYLGGLSGIDVSQNRGFEADENTKLKESLYQLYDKCCGSFVYLLHENPKGAFAFDYLINRGLSLDIIKEFKIGYIPSSYSWLYGFLRSKNYSEEFLGKSGFFSKNNLRASIFFNRVMFPVIDKQGRVVAFSGRSLEDNGPKYINSPETLIYHKGSTLFGINLASKYIRENNNFILCEGNIDVMALHQAGLKNAVAPLGTAFTQGQAKLLKRYASTGTIIFDGDSAGVNATEKACIILEKEGISAEVVPLGDGLDPGEILKKNGSEALKNICKYTINSFDYLLDKQIKMNRSDSPEGKERIAKGMLPYLNSIVSDIRKEACLGLLATKLGVSKQSVIKEFLYSRPKTYEKNSRNTQEIIDIYGDKELYLMGALAVNLSSYNKVFSYVNDFGLQSSNAKEVFNAIALSIKENTTTLESVLRRINKDSLRQIVASKCCTSEFEDNPDKIINDSLLFLKKNTIKKAIKEIEQEVANVDATNNIGDISELLKKKSELDIMLRKIEG